MDKEILQMWTYPQYNMGTDIISNSKVIQSKADEYLTSSQTSSLH